MFLRGLGFTGALGLGVLGFGASGFRNSGLGFGLYPKTLKRLQPMFDFMWVWLSKLGSLFGSIILTTTHMDTEKKTFLFGFQALLGSSWLQERFHQGSIEGSHKGPEFFENKAKVSTTSSAAMV